MKLLATILVGLAMASQVFGDAWQRPMCGRFPNIPGGYVSDVRTKIIMEQLQNGRFDEMRRDSAKYSCHSGYRIVGNSEVFCENGAQQWSEGPRCIPSSPVPDSSNRSQRCAEIGLSPSHSMCLQISPELESVENLKSVAIVRRHNYYRARVDPPALHMPDIQWDDDLAKTAEGWASTCPDGHDDKDNRALPRRNGKEAWSWVGQNIYWNTGNASMLTAVNTWGAERISWFYGIRDPTTVVGHYTQIISARTLYIGCAKTKCKGYWSYVYVCNYGPGGNFDTEGDGQYYAYPYEIATSPNTTVSTRPTQPPTQPPSTRPTQPPSTRPTRPPRTRPSRPPRTRRTRPTRPPTERTTQPTVPPTEPIPSGMSRPSLGPQCRYGVPNSHTFCNKDSPDLVGLEPIPIQVVLDTHNQLRKTVIPPARNMPDLQWDEDLQVLAERLAAICPTLHDTAEQRALPEVAGKPGWEWIGQNMYWYSGASPAIIQTIDSWAREKNDWYYGIQNPTTTIGHYTQIISDRTRFVGCAKSQCRNTRWEYTVICNYGPGGNYDVGNGAYAEPYERADLPRPTPIRTTPTRPLPTRPTPAPPSPSPPATPPPTSPPTVPRTTMRPPVVAGDMTSPKIGPQCHDGYQYPHTSCLYDSPSLIALEPALKSEILERHNYFRQRVNPPASEMPMLQWDDDLAIQAERWAAQCKFDHSENKNRKLTVRGSGKDWDWVGENLCWSAGYNQTWPKCIDDWAEERKDWLYGVGSYNGEVVGHYTQIIWATTLYVGCGKSRCQNARYGEENNLVCHYGPGGNVATYGTDPYAKPYETGSGPAPTTTPTRAPTRPPATVATQAPIPSQQPPVPAPGDLTQPSRGPQCKYGQSKPHALCLDDSFNLIELLPTSKSEVISKHNYYRSRVNPPAKKMPELIWDDDLAISAERWAAQCDFKHSNSRQRALPARNGEGPWSWVGENLCWSTAEQTWSDCIDNWAEEVKDWQYGVGSVNGGVVGHYTQIVWANTLKVGCGRSRCQSAEWGEDYNLVCHYGPGGNLAKSFSSDPYAEPYERI